MTENSQKTRIIRLEDAQVRLEENIKENSKKIDDLAGSFQKFTNNHFRTFETSVNKTLAGFDIKLKNNTKLSWFLLSAVLGLYLLIIYMIK